MTGPPRRISRRALLLGGSAVVLAGGAAVAGSLTDSPGPPGRLPTGTPATGPRTRDAVLAEVDATAGRRLLGSPWADWAEPAPDGWGGVYVSWLLRGAGLPRTGDVAALYDELDRTGRIGGDPAPGAVVFYSRGEGVPPHRAGVVTSVTAGVAQSVEGGHPLTVPPEERFVRRFARPRDEWLVYGFPAHP